MFTVLNERILNGKHYFKEIAKINKEWTPNTEIFINYDFLTVKQAIKKYGDKLVSVVDGTIVSLYKA